MSNDHVNKAFKLDAICPQSGVGKIEIEGVDAAMYMRLMRRVDELQDWLQDSNPCNDCQVVPLSCRAEHCPSYIRWKALMRGESK